MRSWWWSFVPYSAIILSVAVSYFICYFYYTSTPIAWLPPFSWSSNRDLVSGIGVVSLGNAKKPAISPKRCKIGPRLLLRTDRNLGSHIHAFDWYQNQDPGWPWTAYPGTAQSFFLNTRYYLRNRVKLRVSFNFGRHIHKVHPNKSPLKVLEKM